MDITHTKELEKPPPARTAANRCKFRIGDYLVLSLGWASLYFLLRLQFFSVSGMYKITRLTTLMAACSGFIVLAVARFAGMPVARQTRYSKSYGKCSQPAAKARRHDVRARQYALN